MGEGVYKSSRVEDGLENPAFSEKAEEANFGVSDRPNSVQVDWLNLRVTAGKDDKEKVILDNVSGSVRPGELMAIMGASGAGKSTLMNVMTRRNIAGLNVSGRISLNGMSVSEDISKISAYVQQNDVFVGALTVKEHLKFHAKLKLSKETESRQFDRIEEVVRMMGLQKCIDTVIGTPGLTKTISGGEMKRLSIATEILVDPPIIFADEPTSGLDSYLAMAVVQALKKLSRRGTTVLCTIHQPSSKIFEEFDSLQLLAQGKCAFNGPKHEAISFFKSVGFPLSENINPADHYVWETAIMEGDEEGSYKKISAICGAYENSSTANSIMKEQIPHVKSDSVVQEKLAYNKQRGVGFFVSLWWLLWRALIAQYRDKSTIGMKFGQNLGTALIVGLVYLRTPWNPNDMPYDQVDAFNINGAIFSAVCSFSFTYLFLVVFAFPRIQVVLRREYYDGMYALGAAFLAETLAGLPFLLLMPAAFVGIQYCMVGLFASWEAFFGIYLNCILIALSATGYGYMISALAPTIEAANALAPPLMVPLLLFGGFFLQSDSVPVYFIWLKYLSWFYYGAENLYVAQWWEAGACYSIPSLDDPPPNNENEVHLTGTIRECGNYTDCGCLKGGDKLYFVDGPKVIEPFSYKEEHYWRNVGCLCALAFGFRLLGYLVLVYKFRKANR